MHNDTNVIQAKNRFVEKLSRAAGEQLKTLFETKHIYQKVTIDVQQIISDIASSLSGDEVKKFRAAVASIAEQETLYPDTEQLSVAEYDGTQPPLPTLLLRNVKLFCSKCDGRETFTPVWWSDVTNELRKQRRRVPQFESPIPSSFQLYCLVYQCQLCKGKPEAFLIRRDEWQLFLEGRSPMEYVEVSSYIPKVERHLFRDALVAIHGGKPLAALFYLRTFIEQFARRQTSVSGKVTGDELMGAYSETLPAPQRDQMPSLREWYNRISEALHSANDDADLFEQAREAIEQHFDIRRVFKISERQFEKAK